MNGETTVVDLTFRSASGRSLACEAPGVDARSLERYTASEETREKAVQELRRLGFSIVGPATAFGVSISGPSQLVRKVFGETTLSVPGSMALWVETARIPPPGEFYQNRGGGF